MSNEDLALQIQEGQTSLIPVLWEQIERLVHWKACRVSRAVHPDNSFAAADLAEDLYQSGYIAFTEALKTYSAKSESQFSTWLMFYLRREFTEVTGIRTSRQRRDPARHALSLDAPIAHDDGSETEFGALVPDHRATAQLDAVDDEIFQKELQQAVAAVLSTIPEDQQKVIQLRYLEDMSSAEAAEVTGIDRYEVRNIENKALRNLRDPKRAKFLKPYVDYNFYCGTGLGSFLSSGMSVQERYLDHIERMEAHRKGENNGRQE